MKKTLGTIACISAALALGMSTGSCGDLYP